MKRNWFLPLAVAVILPNPAPAERPIDFERDIQPLLARCVSCHGPGQARAGLRLDGRDAATKELRSGNRAVVPGKPVDSELLGRIGDSHSRKRMPPRGPMLSPAQVEIIQRWIAGGANWPEHWAYRPLPGATPPNGTGTPIDRFIQVKLVERGLSSSPAADRRTLLRRVYFDLVGMPPTPEEMDAGLTDSSPDWYEKVVDRLLAAPQHGERMARFWMDLVHFAETHGHDQDRPREHAWPYRDYLIRAFNADKPYGRFVQEQVAGDVLFPDDPWATVATGFLAAGPWDESSLRDIREDSIDREIGRYLDRDDIVTTVMATFVSTTVHCARCHDHKFDPVAQTDYYALQAVFAGTSKANRPFDADAQVANRRRETIRNHSLLLVPSQSWLSIASSLTSLRKELAALPPQQTVYCGTSTFLPDGSFKPSPVPRPVHLLRRGDVRAPGALASAGTLNCIPGLPGRFALADPRDEGSRRAALAHWLTDPRNGLLWRSIANRLWQFHFGQGLVDTPNDFGRMGSAPTHRELLDWLASTLRDNGGSMKQLHRIIVTSAAYRQTCRHRADGAALDADNRYLWRMNRRRLDAESIHDAVLRISGKLDPTMGGPSVKQFHLHPGIHVTPNVDYVNFDADNPANFRRSVYRFLFRTLPDPFSEALDCPDGSQLTPVRGASVTALQALAMRNDKFIVRQSEHIAAKIARHATDASQQVRMMYRLMMGREPTVKETAAVVAYLQKHGLANACRVLLNSNEFMFVD